MARYSMNIVAVSCCALAIGLAGRATMAQRFTPADAAAKLTGTWQMNMDLSPQWAPRGGGAGPTGARGGQQQFFATGTTGMPRTLTAFQRGGRGGGGAGAVGGSMSPEDKAGRTFITSLRQAPQTITFKASADSVTISDARGERTYAVDNKSTKVDINGATVTLKSRWDNRTLKQEFVYGEDRVTHDYELNAEGTRLNWKVVSSSMSNLGPPTEGKAVYDKK
jgi:hypothetical protein